MSEESLAASQEATSVATALARRLSEDAELRASVTTLVDTLKRHQPALEAELTKMLVRFRSTFLAQVELIEPLLKTYGPTLAGLLVAFERLPEEMRSGMSQLAAVGWYVTPTIYLQDAFGAAALIEAGRIGEADDLLAEIVQTSLADLERYLVEELPSRSTLIRNAFSAHKRGEYDLAIPVFFAQVDGVSKNRAGGYFFESTREKKGTPVRPGTAPFVDSVSGDAILKSLMSALTEKGAVNLSRDERPGDFSGLNRHLVMHGESLDYGTRTNSLKCISLLAYVTWSLSEGLQEKASTKR